MFEEIEQLLARLRARLGPRADEHERNWTPPPPVEIDVERHIRTWLVECRLTNLREEDVAFYVNAYRDGQLNYRDIRKRGIPLDHEERKTLRIGGQAVVTKEFMATLNDQGRSDPLVAAELIAVAGKRCHAAKSLAQLNQQGLEAEYLPSNSAAGPCKHAAGLGGKCFTPNEAPLVPLAQCNHPDQCACMYRAHLNL